MEELRDRVKKKKVLQAHTWEDVAKEAGIGVSTVHNVMYKLGNYNTDSSVGEKVRSKLARYVGDSPLKYIDA